MQTRHKIALARMAQRLVTAARRLLGRGMTAAVRRRGIRWHLDLGEGIDFSIYLLGSFEPATVAAYQALVRAGDTVLDIGANIGAHTLHLARAVGAGGKVAAFEPTQFAFAKLQANLALNPELASRVAARQIMLLDGTKPPPPEVYASWPLEGRGDLHETHLGRSVSTAGVRGLTLDAALAELGVQRVDFIKLDVDGFECHVLRGAARTLARFRPPILMELAPHILHEQGESLEALLGILHGHGYGLTSLSSHMAVPMDAGTLRRMIPPGASLNVLARPQT
jgi:FkbM family methyltransferase